MKLNAAIFILVGRPKLFKKTISYFYKYWNEKYKYPLYVHTLGEKISKSEKIYYKKKYKNIYFKTLKPELPKKLDSKDLFYNRFNNDYAFKAFNNQRLGYLHAIHFGANITSFGKNGCLSNKLKKYDFLMRIDDDSWFRKKINFDIFKKIKNVPMASGTLKLAKISTVLTREKLISFLNDFIKVNKIKITNKKLDNILKSNDEKKLELLPYSLGNFEIYNMKIFKKLNYGKFISLVNKNAGIYKYRWADYDLTNLFLYLFYNKPILNLNLKKTTYLPAHPEAKLIKDEIGVINRIYFYLLKRTKIIFK